MAEQQPNTQGPRYVIGLKADNGVDLNKFINKVRMTNSIHSIYPIVTLTLLLDNANIIKNDIFGQTALTLSIELRGEDNIPKEITVFKLLYLQSNLDLSPKTQVSETIDQVYYNVMLTCLVEDCYMIMSKHINYLNEEPASLNPISLIEDALSEIGITNPKVAIDFRNINDHTIDQVIIPPMSVSRMIDFINEKYGIYYGPLFKYCTIDFPSGTPSLKLWDLTQIMNDNAVATIWQMPVDGGSKKNKIVELCVDDLNFYTIRSIKTLNYANSNIIKNRYDKTQIIHPEDELYDHVHFTMDDIVKTEGTSENKVLTFNPKLKEIEKHFCINLKGQAYNAPYGEAHLSSRMADQMKNNISIGITLEHNLRITNLVKVGSCVQFEPAVAEYVDYQGKYIMRNSDIIWVKQGDQWDTICNMTLMRTVRSKTPPPVN